jgi:hypothetical protein
MPKAGGPVNSYLSAPEASPLGRFRESDFEFDISIPDRLKNPKSEIQDPK